MNGDGYDDVVIGASAFAVSGTPVGAVYVYHGSATGIGTAPSTTLVGDATSGIGYDVAGGGDVNGDGFDDLLISSDLAEARVFHGSAAGIPSGGPAAADATLTCPPTTLGVPLSEVGGIGDVNGDGYDDVAVGCTTTDDAGVAMVFLGSATGISSGGSEAADWVLRGVDQEVGNAEAEFFGADIAGADLNGDGFSDFIVSDFGYAPEGDPNDLGIDSGLILVLFGGPAGLTPEVAERTLRLEGPIDWEQLAGTARRRRERGRPRRPIRPGNARYGWEVPPLLRRVDRQLGSSARRRGRPGAGPWARRPGAAAAAHPRWALRPKTRSKTCASSRTSSSPQLATRRSPAPGAAVPSPGRLRRRGARASPRPGRGRAAPRSSAAW